MLQSWEKVRQQFGTWTRGCTSLLEAGVEKLGFRRTARVQELLADLETAQHELQSACQRLERRFLVISEDLQKSSRLSDALVLRGETLVSLAVGQTNGETDLHNAVRVLNEPLAFLKEYDASSAELVERLPRCEAALNAVCKLRPVMQGAVVPLKFVQTLFRVESASLPPEVCAMFTGLAQDIEQLYNQVSQTLDEQFTNLETARATIQRLVGKLQAQVQSHQHFVTDKKDAVDRSLRNLEQILQASQERDFRFSKSTRGVCDAVNHAVVGLQFQDITRQKLEHVAAALAKMQKCCDDLASARGASAREILQFINQTSRIQLHQLQAVLTDLQSAETTIRSATETIATDASKLDANCLKLDGLGGNSAAEDGMVQVLLDVTGEIQGLMMSTVKLQLEIGEATRPLNGLASNFTGGLRQLSRSIRLIALNAQVHAAQIGSGTGLEVLSERTCHISDEANAVNERAAAQLTTLSTTLEQIATDCASLGARSSGQLEALTLEGGRLEKRLHDYRDLTLGVFQEVTELALRLREHLATAQENTAFAAEAADQFARVQAPLLELVSATDKFAIGIDAGAANQAGQLSAHYTMESERVVHEAALGAPSVEGKPARTKKPAPAAALADTGVADDGVELF